MPDKKRIRSPSRDIYSVNFADYLPETLKRDKKMKALAAAVTKQMLGVSAEINNVLIYSRIDELPEELIDILAFDMHVDWYDDSLPLDVKRNVLKNSVKVHKKMGTKFAVDELTRVTFGGGGAKEWFEYGGKPYWFKICTTGILTKENVVYFTEMLQWVKNTRSHVQALEVYRNTKQEIYAGAGMSLVYKPAAIMDGYYVEQDVKQRIYAGTAGAAAYRPAAVMDGYHVKQETGMHAYAGTAISAGYKPPAVMDGFRQKRSASSEAYAALGGTSIFRNTITE